MTGEAHTPRYIALCVIGADRAQYEPLVKMARWGLRPNARRLSPIDCAADLPPRWRAALRSLVRGLSVGAVMHNKLYRAGLIEYALGGRHRRPRLTPYARGVARALGCCPHEQVSRGPDYAKTYRSGEQERVGCEVCGECGARRAVRLGGRELWHPADRWVEHALGSVDGVRELPDHEEPGPWV